MEYKSLEPSNLNTLGVAAPSFSGSAGSFFASTTFIYTLLFMAIILVGFGKAVQAGILMVVATSKEDFDKARKILTRIAWTFLGVFSIPLILMAINKDLLIGDVGFGALEARKGEARGGGLATPSRTPSSQGGTSIGSASCEATDAVIRKMNAGNICAGVTCRALTGCNYTQYLSIIEREAAAAGVDKDLIIVTMCRESSAKPDSKNKNPNNTYDCGLMQINQEGGCSEEILKPEENIRKGVAMMKTKMNYATQLYPNIPATAGVFASYNCCANGTVPNAPSVDCTKEAGFPYTLPKWACPINPGEGQYNMCTVKNYTCELSACLMQLQQ